MYIKQQSLVNIMSTRLFSAEEEELSKFGKSLLFLALQWDRKSGVTEFDTFNFILTQKYLISSFRYFLKS